MPLNYASPYLDAAQGFSHAGDVLGEVFTDLAKQRYQQQYQNANLALRYQQMQQQGAYHQQQLRQQEKHYQDQAAVSAAEALLNTQKQKNLAKQAELGQQLGGLFQQYNDTDPLVQDFQPDIMRDITGTVANLASYHPQNIAEQTAQAFELGNPASRAMMLPHQPRPIAMRTQGPGQQIVDETGNVISPQLPKIGDETNLKTLQSLLASANAGYRNVVGNPPDIPAETDPRFGQYSGATNLIGRITSELGRRPLSPGGVGATPTVTTKEQFDALPSGSTYIGKDGRKYRKP